MMSRRLKNLAKRSLPPAWIYFYHSVRVARQLGIFGPLFRTLGNVGDKVRIGGEAGWTIPKSLLGPSSLCYCIGCGEDISFDLAVIERYGCRVLAFDPTPRAVAYVKDAARDQSRFTLHEFAIWDKEELVRFYIPPVGVSHSIINLEGTDAYIEVPAKRLRHFVETYRHPSIALLKMDVEGAEHTVIRTVVEDRLPVEVLCVEFDELARHGTPERLAGIRATIQLLLDAGFDYYWIEGSNFTFRRRR